MALLLRVAGQRDPDVPLAHPPRRIGRAGAAHPRRRARHARVRHRARRHAARSTRTRRGERRRRPTSCGCPSHAVARTLVTNDSLRRTLAALKQGAVEFFQVDIGDGVKLDAWMMKPADFDPIEEVSDPVLRLRRAGGPDGVGRYGGSGLALAPDAHAAGLHRGERRQPRHARARGAATGERRCSIRSARCGCATSPPRRATSAGGRTSIRRGWASGAGAAADRPRCSSCSARPTCTRWACRWRRWPTCTTTTPSTRNATSACPPPTRPRTATRRRSTSSTGLRGDLLVVHGSGDDNVHFQGTEQLINALVAAGQAVPDDGVPEPHARHLRGQEHAPAPVQPAHALPQRASPAGPRAECLPPVA